MKAVILVGGKGTRLRPITYEIPKPLVPVKKRPIINHLISFFWKNKVTGFALLASREHEDDFAKWRKVWGHELPMERIQVFYEDEPRGTLGGLELLTDWLGPDDFIVSNGDELKECELQELTEFHKSHDGLATIWLVSVPNAHEYGVPVLRETRVVEFLEKPENPPSSYINSGLYLFHPDVLKYVDFSQKGEIMTERHLFPALARAGKLHGLRLAGRWYDCGNLERWEKAIKEW